MPPTDIRAHVLGVARRDEGAPADAADADAPGRDGLDPDEAILVSELTNPETGETFYRPPGGGIEFGESSAEAVVREFREEMGLAVTPRGYLGTVENRFEFDGRAAHELAVVHEVAFDDASVYDRAVIDGVDAGGTVTYEATWEPLDQLVAGDQPLYPEGIERVLRGETTHLIS